MAEMQWIKLRIDMFDDEKIKIIQAMPEGDSILVVWIRLIALAGKCNTNGLVLIEDEFPFTDEMLSVIFGKSLQTVRLALKTLEKFHMIENTTKGIYIINFNKHQNIEGMDKIREQNRLRKRRERERKAALLLEQETSEGQECPDAEPENADVTKPEAVSGDTSHDAPEMSRDQSREVTQQREDKEKEEEKDNNISLDSDIAGESAGMGEAQKKAARKHLGYDAIMEDYNCTCPDLPQIRAVSEARRRAVRGLLRELEKLKIMQGTGPYEKLHKIFQMAQDSSFLSGRSGIWRGCSFDWLMNKTNALKVLEGNYADKGNGGGPGGSPEGGTGGQSGTADGREVDSATLEALELLRENGGAEDL
ncbi:MAG: hypothetical protein HFH59_06760 [Lachnospiraceae bacterium]|nr:hypothetical protein [Lachnospiraceae bacterium]